VPRSAIENRLSWIKWFAFDLKRFGQIHQSPTQLLIDEAVVADVRKICRYREKAKHQDSNC